MTATNDVRNEFFIYVPTVHGVEALTSLDTQDDEDEENDKPPANKKAWVKIPIGEELVVYTQHWNDDDDD
jgi:hypothetical protein